MPLLVSGDRINEVPRDIKEFLNNHTTLKEASTKLRDLPSRDVGPQGLLYVCQKEYAVAPVSAENIEILGADDATTCHILVMKHSGSGSASIAHLDGSKTKKFIEQVFSKLKKTSLGSPDGRFEAHLAGGFLDDKSLSVGLSLEILEALMSLPDDIHLLTACITDWNDTVRGSTHFPIIYGLAYELKTGALYPAKFPDKGPDVDIRSASHHGSGCRPTDVFENNLLVVGPFQWNIHEKFVEYYQSKPDHYFLQNWSTSPEQEPAHFVKHIRDALRVLRDHPDPSKTLFADNKPRLYRKHSDGQWLRCN